MQHVNYYYYLGFGTEFDLLRLRAASFERIRQLVEDRESAQD
jgi:hypothetical protein